MSVIRAFGPQVIIVLTAANDGDATRRDTAPRSTVTPRGSARAPQQVLGLEPGAARILVNRLRAELARR